MPFTPFHFGPGLLGKGLAARWYSFTAFVAANVLIDCESFYHLIRGDYPVHARLHTFVGAALAGIVTATLLLGVCRVRCVRAWLEQRAPTVRAEGSMLGICVGSMLGALSHPLLDGFMHHDIEPLQPWSAANPLLGVVGLEALHSGCLIAGLAGGIALTVQRLRDRR